MTIHAPLTPDAREIAAVLRAHAEALPSPDAPDFAASFDRFGDARVVLLGETTHGTHEFYAARAQITRRLIERHGFNIVAVEGDWRCCQSDDNSSPVEAPRARSAIIQAGRFCHSANAPERRSL